MAKQQAAHSKRIDFGKTTPQARIKDNPGNEMHVIIKHDGTIVHANDAFAASLGITSKDIVGRPFLDSVLFENYDVLMDDRAIFNSMSNSDLSSITHLQEGEHTLIIGAGQQHTPFYFTWVAGQGGQKYLVAHSIDASQKASSSPDWTSIIDALTPSNSDQRQFKDTAEDAKTSVAKRSLKPSLKKVSGKPVHKIQALDANDLEKFIGYNRDLLCLMESDGILMRVNDAFSNCFDKTTVSFLSLVHPDDKASARQAIQSLAAHDIEDGLDDSAHIVFESRMKTHDNDIIWVEWHLHKEDKMLYCLGHDITKAKDNENALIRREQELFEAQALARMGHWRWNVGSTEIEWSDQIYEIFGVNRNEFTPTLDNTNNLLHKRDIGRMMQAFQRAIIEQNNYDMDFRVVREDNSIRYVRCEGRCELDEDGDAIALYGVMQDITEQTEHEMELREAKDSAEQAYAAKSRFLANMSHELRTPLNAIIGFSDMIQRQMLGPLGSEKYVDYATSIKDSGEHLLDLITDILDMSKIEAGKYELDLENIQLGNVVNTAVRMIESRAQEGVLTLDNQIQGDDPVIKADRRAIMQILLNVLSNAVKFTEPGGTITVSCEEFDNHVTVRIQDTGIGIPANKLNAVMRPFEQVSTAFTRNHEGSGLGLAITKELAELHGGMLHLESSVGQGTTASLRLPKNPK
jgi:two-component system cell cycle sensor histidine kinase PleC